MKLCRKLNIAFICSGFALLIALSLVVAFCWRVGDYSVVDAGTYISILVSIMTLIFALMVGYQIYNAWEIKQQLKDVELLKKELNHYKTDFYHLENEQKEGFYYMQARLYFYVEDYQNAIIKYFGAIRYSLLTNHEEDGYDWIIDDLSEYMLKIYAGSFGGGTPQQLQPKIQRFREYIVAESEKIQKSKNYFIIRKRYEELMRKFNVRLDLIAEAKIVDLFEIDKEYCAKID